MTSCKMERPTLSVSSPWSPRGKAGPCTSSSLLQTAKSVNSPWEAVLVPRQILSGHRAEGDLWTEAKVTPHPPTSGGQGAAGGELLTRERPGWLLLAFQRPLHSSGMLRPAWPLQALHHQPGFGTVVAGGHPHPLANAPAIFMAGAPNVGAAAELAAGTQ